MQRSGGAEAGDREHEGKVRVTIRRDDPDAESTFLVDRTEPMLVLDLLLAVRREYDPSLAFRHSCRVAMCNTCGVRVDGEPVLACQVPVLPERDDLLIEPLDGAPVIRDLIVSMDQLVDGWA